MGRQHGLVGRVGISTSCVVYTIFVIIHFCEYLFDRSEIMWSVEDEQRLRKHIGRLKGERTMVRSTAVELESVHAEPLNSKNTISLAEARKLDLETAVLMQVGI